jgi:hypothetical protein
MLALADRGSDLVGRVLVNSAQRPLRSESDRLWSLSTCTNSISRCFVAQMFAQQYAKPAQRPHAHHLEGMP